MPPNHVIGGGLAGSEAAWQIAQAGFDVVLHEMRPVRKTEAHQTDGLAELVCSNSFRSDDSEQNAVGLIHHELRQLGSLIMASADANQVPAGSALAVDRHGFSDAVTKALEEHPRITISRDEVAGLPPEDWEKVIIATGPLTSPALSEAVLTKSGEDALAFFDAIAPIVHFDSIDLDKAWFQSRYDKVGPGGTGKDYINCPMDKEQYEAFVAALLDGEKTEFKAPYFIVADLKKDATKVIKKRPGASIVDLGDGVLLVEWHAKMNALGEDQLRAVQDAHKLVQDMGYAGLVLGNQGEHFSAGANLPLILSQAQADEWDELDDAIKQFQQVSTSMRFSPHPTVAAPFNMALGGGCEFSIHADQIVASAELYMGLVEVGVGLIPGGGGTKEMLLRFTDQLHPNQQIGASLLPAVQRAFELIGTAKVSTSALEARKLGFLQDHDTVVMNKNHVIQKAKRAVLALAPDYVQPVMRQDIPVMGDAAIGAIKSALYGMHEGGYITDYDLVVSGELARVLSGGTGNNRTAKVSEQHLLDLEREAFLTLLGKKGTQQRIEHMLKTGKPLRN